MTDKEKIMIDGVDVSGCRYGEIEKDVFKCSCEYNVRSASMFCKDNPNCHYKLYKRKEQEYEELRQYHNKCCEEFEKEKQNLIDRYNQFSKDFFIGKYCKKEYCDLLKAKEQECEKLKIKLMQKDEVDMFFNTPIEGWSNDPCGICPHKAENEELEEEILTKNEKIKELRFSVSDLTNRLCCLNAEKSFRIVDLEQALDEIEEYVQSQLDGFGNDVYLMHKVAINKILDIINKAKDGKHG